jgi:hypothetical protein
VEAKLAGANKGRRRSSPRVQEAEEALQHLTNFRKKRLETRRKEHPVTDGWLLMALEARVWNSRVP